MLRRGYLVLLLVFLVGCTSTLFRGQNPETENLLPDDDEAPPRLVREVAVPYGLNQLKVESVALVTRLDGTGSDPAPGAQRQVLIGEMQSYGVKPNGVLASPTTALVVTRGFLPPGVEEGDRFDIELQVPGRSEATSLRGGKLMQSRLRRVQVNDSNLHTGHIIALAEGSVLVDSLFQSEDDPLQEKRGRVLGGGVSQITRPMGLVLRSRHTSVQTSAMVGEAINRRFHRYHRGEKSGVAKPKNDNFIEIAVQPRYKNNVGRYIRVIQALAFRETPGERVTRLNSLVPLLLDPATSADAALQLEAIGKEGIGVLRQGLQSSDEEVRFFAAEALAWLDEPEGVNVLADTVRDQHRYRWQALTALAALTAVEAQDVLLELLSASSAEARYGAFRAMVSRNPRDPMIQGEPLGRRDQFAFHVVVSRGEPMVHITKTRRPEVVVFGHDQRITPPSYLFAGKRIMIRATGADDQLRIIRYVPGEDQVERVCPNTVVALVRTIADLGGDYADVVTALTAAKEAGYLPSRLAVDARPDPKRAYEERPDEPSQSVNLDG